MAAKKTADLIPLCHPVPLSSVRVMVEIDDGIPGLAVRAEAKTAGSTGVEMEALCAVSVACLTIYDMLKAAERGIVIERIELVEKRGGASGDWSRG
jgi:cyclic pyranopterin phosphate synthase